MKKLKRKEYYCEKHGSKNILWMGNLPCCPDCNMKEAKSRIVEYVKLDDVKALFNDDSITCFEDLKDLVRSL